MRPEPTVDGGDHGWALVSVLWVLSLLALLAAATQTLTFTSALTEHHAMERARADAILDAGVSLALVGIMEPRRESRWPVDGEVRRISFGGAVLQISVQDEFGKIDLNAADGSLLRQLLVANGLSFDNAASLVDKILDWRGPSDLKRLHGANDADYAAAGYSYHPRHGPFQTVDELRLVMGMTTELFRKIRPALTVYSKRPAIDTNTAPKEALLAYFPNQPDKVDALLKLREATSGVLDPALPHAGRIFSVTTTLARGRLKVQRHVVIELTRSTSRPYLILAWL